MTISTKQEEGRGEGVGREIKLVNESKVVTASNGHAYEINTQNIICAESGPRKAYSEKRRSKVA